MLAPTRTTLTIRARGGATALALFNARIAAIEPTLANPRHPPTHTQQPWNINSLPVDPHDANLLPETSDSP